MVTVVVGGVKISETASIDLSSSVINERRGGYVSKFWL